jgi:hypothetical protein
MSVVNYPAQWKRVAHTRGGVEFRIRPIRADDLLRDKDFIMGLSPESRYTRTGRNTASRGAWADLN